MRDLSSANSFCHYPFLYLQALNQVAKMKQDLEHLRGGPFLHCLQKVSELETLPVTILKQIQQQIRVDLETIEKVSPPKLPGCFSVSLRDARTVGAEQNSCGFGGRMIHSTNMPT